MFGVCAGQKRQVGVSKRVGQYNYPPHSKFNSSEQYDLKVKVMELVNQYVQLVEAVLKERFPETFRNMSKLHAILHRHPVFHQDGCSLESQIFTNGYVSIGRRSTGRHTDYRNAIMSHLTTRKIGAWGSSIITGQTVLYDRWGKRAIVIEDSEVGRQVFGGLNAIAHSNFEP